ncbi:hypothetical protein ACFX1W_010576 [Malus domestica]
MLILETHSLRTTDASFSELLYGLRRRAVKIKAMRNDDAGLNPGDGIQHYGLEKRQRFFQLCFWYSLSSCLLILFINLIEKDLLPYFKSKLHSIYNREREARLQASLWGHVDERFDDIDTFGRGEDAVVSRGTSDMVVSVRTRLTKKIQKFIGAWYPLLHANREGLHALGIHVCRAAGQELVYSMDTSSRKQNVRDIVALHG